MITGKFVYVLKVQQSKHLTELQARKMYKIK